MEITPIVVWYVLPLIICLLLGPKTFAVDSDSHYSHNKVKWKHLFTAIVISVIPTANIGFVLGFLWYWSCQFSVKTKIKKFLNKDIF